MKKPIPPTGGIKNETGYGAIGDRGGWWLKSYNQWIYWDYIDRGFDVATRAGIDSKDWKRQCEYARVYAIYFSYIAGGNIDELRKTGMFAEVPVLTQHGGWYAAMIADNAVIGRKEVA